MKAWTWLGLTGVLATVVAFSARGVRLTEAAAAAGARAAADANGAADPHAVQAAMAHLHEEVRPGGDAGQALVIDNGVYRASFSANDGVVYTPRHAGALERRLSWRYHLRAMVTGDSARRLAVVKPAVSAEADHVVEFMRPELIERYAGERAGVTQTFVLTGPPSGRGDVRLVGDVRFGGTSRSIEGTLTFDAGHGLPVFTYAAPVAFDALHAPVPVRVESSSASLTLVVDGAALDRVRWPVTIVPRFGAARPEGMGPPWSDVSRNYARREMLVVFTAAAGVSGTEVRGRRFDEAGRALAPSFTIAGGAATSLHAPRAACDPGTGRYLVVWSREQGPVEAVLLDSAGTAVTPPFSLPGNSRGPSFLAPPGPVTSRALRHLGQQGHGNRVATLAEVAS